MLWINFITMNMGKSLSFIRIMQLTWLKNVKNLRGCLFCWPLKLSIFDYEIKYQKDSTNIEVDMLSWSPISENISHHVDMLDLN